MIVGVLVALLLVPVLWKKSTTGGSADGADHATAAPAGPGYLFLLVNRSGTPVRWNPCQPISYQLDLAGAPSWAQTDIGDAISSISTATGITFVPDGSTDQFPSGQVPAGSTADNPAPVVIAWATADQSRQLNLAVPASAGGGSGASGTSSGGASSGGASSGGTAGGGGAAAAGSGTASGGAASSAVAAPAVDSFARTLPVVARDEATDQGIYVTGSIIIGAGAADLPEGFGPGGAGVLLLHQLGRLVGLGDVSDPSQVMDTGVLSTRVTALGAGDLAGLKRLGRESGCLKTPANPSLHVVY